MEATRTLGKYTLVRHLATGGMAKIWLAEQLGPGGFNKELVIKQILPHLGQDENFVKMFLDEARLAAQLSHPKIAQIYELGEENGDYFIAMEFVDGADLSDMIAMAKARQRPIPLGVAAKIVMDVLEALDYAHDFTSRDGTPYNLVHRDVTPQNVIVSNDGIVKLVDFGVAKAKANQAKTQAGAVKGKYAYMAPEQIQSQEIDRRVDIFAVGVLFYELLSGEKPFGDDLAAITNILTQPIPDVREIRADIPEAVVAVLVKATAKTPDERYVDAHDMLRDIETFLREHVGYVGDREVAAYIRDMKGLPTTRHTAASPKPSSQPQPNMPAATPTPGPLNTPEPAPAITRPGLISEAPREHTQEEIMMGQGGTAQLPSVDVPPFVARTDTQTVDSVGAPEPKSNTGLIAIFVVVLLVVAAVGIFVAYTLVQNNGAETADTKDSKTTKITKTTKPQETKPTKPTKPVVPKIFNHGNAGVIVSVHCRPSAEIYYKDIKVGSTSLQTRLKPGEYEIRFKSKTIDKTKKFTVSASNPIHRVSCD